jgi:hypothetical protein
MRSTTQRERRRTQSCGSPTSLAPIGTYAATSRAARSAASLGAELPSAIRQRAILNDEIRRRVRRHLDRKGRRRIAVRNIPIPDRFAEVGNRGGGRMLLKKPSGAICLPPKLGGCNSSCERPIGCSDTTRKAPSCNNNGRRPRKPSAAPHSALGAFGGFPWHFLVAIITVETFAAWPLPQRG